MPIRHALPVTVLALAVAACTGGTAPTAAPASGGPSAAPTAEPSPTIDGIAHPTGADEVVLRYEEAGGFVPPEWNAARLPGFTLYGDGRVVFVQTTAVQEPRADNVFVNLPLRTGRLSEAQVQGLLEFALKDGGLAIAKTDYQNPMVADAPTTVFTINAENDTKTVSAVALGMANEPGPDAIVLAQLATLAERLRDFDQGGSLASEPYEAAAYRAVILEQQGIQGVEIRDWPWVDLPPSDFGPPVDPDALQQLTRVITPAEATALGIEGFQNGISSGVFAKAPDGKLYSIVIRPLLPDEKA
jgi:hypothetical protein